MAGDAAAPTVCFLFYERLGYLTRDGFLLTLAPAADWQSVSHVRVTAGDERADDRFSLAK
jgi:hypothetical protein